MNSVIDFCIIGLIFFIIGLLIPLLNGKTIYHGPNVIKQYNKIYKDGDKKYKFIPIKVKC